MSNEQFDYQKLAAKGFVPDGRGGFFKPKAGHPVAITEPKRDVERSSHDARPVKEESAGRRLVRIVCFRINKLDKDNLYGGCKFFVDALRYSNLIREDDPDAIELEITQIKVKHRCLERTEIEIAAIK